MQQRSPQADARGRWTLASRLSTPRGSHTATLLLDGTVLIVGGGSTGTPLTSAERYAPRTGTWSTTGSLATGRRWHTATLLQDGTVLVTGGVDSDFSLAVVERYDPRHDTWLSSPSMSFGRAEHTATRLADGRVLVVGTGGGRVLAPGPDRDARRQLAELYDAASDTWSEAGRMVVPRTHATATLLADGRVLVAGGASPGPTAAAEAYDPRTNTWSATANMASPRTYHAAVLLPDGRVLVSGGAVEWLPPPWRLTSTVELFDPQTGEWYPAAAMREARQHHRAVVLDDGRVLVMGGSGGESGFHALATAELYDPLVDTWVSAGTMNIPRTAHTATLLANGQVMVVGGGLGEAALTAELYDPP